MTVVDWCGPDTPKGKGDGSQAMWATWCHTTFNRRGPAWVQLLVGGVCRSAGEPGSPSRQGCVSGWFSTQGQQTACTLRCKHLKLWVTRQLSCAWAAPADRVGWCSPAQAGPFCCRHADWKGLQDWVCLRAATAAVRGLVCMTTLRLLSSGVWRQSSRTGVCGLGQCPSRVLPRSA